MKLTSGRQMLACELPAELSSGALKCAQAYVAVKLEPHRGDDFQVMVERRHEFGGGEICSASDCAHALAIFGAHAGEQHSMSARRLACQSPCHTPAGNKGLEVDEAAQEKSV